MLIKFQKYHGNGNDFIIVDNRENLFPSKNYSYIKFLCDRHFGIGADGLMLLENMSGVDFYMRYYNSDGFEGSMCGNGGRAIVKFAYDNSIIGKKTVFEGIDGKHEAEVMDNIIDLKMQDVSKIELLEGSYIIDTGSPHFVTFVSEVAKTDVVTKGREIRFSNKFKKEGINVNFIEKVGDIFNIRTYERGVENETLACGTGSVAAAIAIKLSGLTDASIVKLQTGGGPLEVSFVQTGQTLFTNIWLKGPAVKVFDGTVNS